VFPCIGIKESTSVLRDLVKTQFGGLDEGATPVFGVNIDVPNGYCPKLIDRVKEIRELLPDGFISAGVVVTPDMCQDIINAGADAVRVGIGSGQQCLTRLKTGVGRPQFSTIVECADACHQMNAYCICDGGCSTPGDICKALCAGADIVMCGSIFGGADETDAEEKMVNGKKYKQFFGMSSHLAQEKYFGGMASYRTSEGREKWIPGTGPLENTLNDITGGLRSCGTYIGARTIKNFSRQAAFYKVRRLVNANFANCADI
jgi:GMP reductase